MVFHAKNYLNRPMFHGVIQKITLAVFLRHGVLFATILPRLLLGARLAESNCRKMDRLEK